MHRTMALAIAVLLTLSVLVSCGGGWIVDDALTATVTFDGNGATSGEMEAQTVGKGIPTRLSANTFEKTDLIFIGWNTEPDGSGTEYLDGQISSITEDTTLYAQWGIILTNGMTSWTDGNKYVLTGDVTLGSRVSVTGSAILVLRDGYTLTASGGIGVNEGNSLTISAQGAGTGELTASGEMWCAGIGGDYQSNTGTITINGGKITATSDAQGAGIGGSVEGSVGTIIINGGTVNATGGSCAAGIGGGYGLYCNGGTITINGGTVKATGGASSAGIGTGFIECNITIIINGGKITANGGNYGAGIGTGYKAGSITLTINDGTITANGGNGGAGIGGGYCIAGIDVTINNGTIIATGGENVFSDYGMGIGKGSMGSSDGTLTLGQGVAMQVSTDNTDWAAYDGTTRTRYMKTI